MMREFKFRAWYKPTQKMYEVLTLDIIDEKALIENNDNPKKPLRGYAKMVEIELMQSTGLKDKNGVEIYEGDIVRWKDLESFDDFPIDEVFKVEYSDEFTTWIACYKNNLQYKSDLRDDLYDFTDNRDLEVIGNIYENGDLIND